jgi:hypothetical protein
VSEAPGDEAASTSSGGRRAPRRVGILSRFADLGASAQAAIPGLYAWAITVAPAAWSRGSPIVAKAAALLGVLALLTAPLVEGRGEAARARGAEASLSRASSSGPRSAVTWARAWSIWGLVLSSAIVWALSPAALSSARMDGVRGALGLVGWGLFAFASAGPALRADVDSPARIVAGSPLKPRSELPRGDGVYVALGVVLALAMQLVGWNVAVPERAVLVRLVTVASGIAVLGGMTSIALVRHTPRVQGSSRIRMRRALPWLALLALGAVSGAVLSVTR